MQKNKVESKINCVQKYSRNKIGRNKVVHLMITVKMFVAHLPFINTHVCLILYDFCLNYSRVTYVNNIKCWEYIADSKRCPFINLGDRDSWFKNYYDIKYVCQQYFVKD